MGRSFLKNVVGEYITTLGEKNEKVVMVNADLSGTCRNGSFVEKFPALASILPFNIFSKWVDLALEWMREQLDKNENIRNMIQGN